MIYALIDTRADDFFMTKLVWGDVQQVANAVFKSCEWIFESFPNMSMEDIENECDCSLDAYKVLSKGNFHRCENFERTLQYHCLCGRSLRSIPICSCVVRLSESSRIFFEKLL